MLCIGLALTTSRILTAAPDHRGTRFFAWTNFESWERIVTRTEQTWSSPPFDCSFSWNELVLSWNANTPTNTALKFEARAFGAARATDYYLLGQWTEHSGAFPRRSVSQHKDTHGEVRTDTLVLREPCDRAQVRVTLRRAEGADWPRLHFLGAVLSQSNAPRTPLPPNRSAWGRTIDVPCRSQVDYPDGVNAWCSPTCVSMVLAHWARVLHRPQLDMDVPRVAQGVYDPDWRGTGNWSFNTAFAGSFAGMRAYVTRLSDVSEIEDWLARDVPVVASVCYDQLRGRPRRRDSGHLVVCVGFASNGDVVVNDPGTRHEKRRSFPRADFVKAWAHSNQTVYLIYPTSWRVPRDRFGHFFVK